MTDILSLLAFVTVSTLLAAVLAFDRQPDSVMCHAALRERVFVLVMIAGALNAAVLPVIFAAIALG
jgi:phosphoribosylcarboxyaminoimidazole (NCAIR) mutase